MIRALQTEATNAADSELIAACNLALATDDDGVGLQVWTAARQLCASAINSARAMDDTKPFVRVAP